jgi:RHS repeat-associated protein
VGASGSATIHTQASLPVNKSGYLYIYTSNEATNIDVYFDNLQLTHTRGPLLEETHYYPFGLVMQGISSKAANTLENKRKFNQGTELNTDFDLGLYETPFRAYDPQTGHFNQIDPYADAFMDWTPYNYSLNNPISLNDPTGLTPGFPDDKRRNVLPEVIVRPSVRYMNASQRDAFWAKNSHWVNGQRVLGKISYYDNETQRYLSEYNQMQIRGDAFNKVYGKVVLNVAVAAVPWGKVFQGFGWAYRAAKGSQLVSRLGGRFLTELSKEILNNRGNIKEVDMFDVMTNTLLAGKGGIFGKIGVEGLNALVDIKSTAISIYGLKNGYGKMGNEVGLDLMFSGVKLFAGGALEGLGMNGSGLNAYDVVLDQGKKTISDAAAEQ